MLFGSSQMPVRALNFLDDRYLHGQLYSTSGVHLGKHSSNNVIHVLLIPIIHLVKLPNSAAVQRPTR